jgi:hypothetical protein
MTGTSPVTLTDAMVLPPLINADINLDNIREAAAAYTQYAREHGNYERKRRADVLNKHGRELKALKVGDYVKIYVPPSHGEAVRRRRKAKHICQWHSPLRLTKQLSNTTFEMSHHFNPSKIYKRQLCNVRRWRGPLPDAVSDETYSLPLAVDIEL